jgi:hypothetical protein
VSQEKWSLNAWWFWVLGLYDCVCVGGASEVQVLNIFRVVINGQGEKEVEKEVSSCI